MLQKTTIDLRKSGVLSHLVSDYLDKNEKLKSAYSFFPDLKGYGDFIKSEAYKNFDHAALYAIMSQQSRLTANVSEQSLLNLELLKQKNTYTITTGHQLCLFTGPLYFLYKIISTINLAEALKTKFPGSNFVPVYWMASEDHDFPEVDHFHSSGSTVRWKTDQQGAVGDFATGSLKDLLPELRTLFGRSENSERLLQLFETAYLKHQNLADATRYLVNELFGEYGILVVDGNDKAFKAQFRETFKKDIFENAAFNYSEAAIKELQQNGYPVQVNPRPINCFYIEKGSRLRIEEQNGSYQLVGTSRSFSKAEMEKIIDTEPEKISPNVVLRPLYQQVILPNLAYIGGPGELAYWLEFKSMFDTFGIVFPILTPRNFVTIIDKHTGQTIDKLGLPIGSVYKPEQELVKEVQISNNAFFDLHEEADALQKMYDTLLKRSVAIDKTLEGSVAAELKRSLNGLARIAGKGNRAHRRKLDTEMNRIRSVKGSLFPQQVPQERYENFSGFYLTYGKSFIAELKQQLDPLVLEQIILCER